MHVEPTQCSSFMPKQCRPPPHFTRIIDTGTSHHNLALGDGNPQHYIPYTTNAPQVMIPNGANITAHARYNLQLQNFSRKALEADILPSFKHLLLSVGSLCDDDCTAIFSKHNCTIYNKNNQPVITGIRNHTTGLYEQHMPTHNNKNVHQANATLPTTNLQKHIKYLHQCAFSLTTRTWLQAVKKGHFKTWPSVTVETIQCYLPKSEATMLGHLDQQRKNIQSTKLNEDDQDTTHTLSPLEKGLSTHALYAAPICYNEPTGKLYYRLSGAISCSKQ